MKQLNRQWGISLVEILVALVISLFLLAGIVQVYVGNKATFSFTNALAEVQENGRFALDTMSQDLRLASEWGCVIPRTGNPPPAGNGNINNTLTTWGSYSATLHDFVDEEAIEGTNNTGLNGSDTVTIRGAKPGQANVRSPFIAQATSKLNITSGGRIGAGDIILVTRCGDNDLLSAPEADILRVTNAVTAAGTTDLTIDGNKSQIFENDASVTELQTVTYWIDIQNLRPLLMRTEFGVAQEMVEGVEDMQILYGVDSSGDDFANQYVTSNNVADFDDVVSIRIMLLLQSLSDFVTEVPQTYTFNGATGPAADRRLRQVFTTTIALRNRIGEP